MDDRLLPQGEEERGHVMAFFGGAAPALDDPEGFFEAASPIEPHAGEEEAPGLTVGIIDFRCQFHGCPNRRYGLSLAVDDPVHPGEPDARDKANPVETLIADGE